jgi:hypothetical protein
MPPPAAEEDEVWDTCGDYDKLSWEPLLLTCKSSVILYLPFELSPATHPSHGRIFILTTSLVHLLSCLPCPCLQAIAFTQMQLEEENAYFWSPFWSKGRRVNLPRTLPNLQPGSIQVGAQTSSFSSAPASSERRAEYFYPKLAELVTTWLPETLRCWWVNI